MGRRLLLRRLVFECLGNEKGLAMGRIDKDAIALDAARKILEIAGAMPLSQYKARIQLIVRDAMEKACPKT
jgi:hypothetical protein